MPVKHARIIMHLDMNSYFASVEQQANPFLRGRSVGVCAYLSERGCIIASSAEAKAKGIKTGCHVDEAKRLDPDVVLLENDPGKYRTVTEQIFNILRSYSGTVEPYSIDEAFIDLTGWVKDFLQAEKLAREIQQRIRNEVGEWLYCSVGISWTKFLAKFAGDIALKRDVFLIDSQQKLNEVLDGRNLQDAWGINRRMEARLNEIGIYSLSDLQKYDPDNIRRILGRYGYYLWAHVNGIEISSVNEGSAPPKSIGHSYCLPRKTTDKKYLSMVLYKLCEKTGRKLRGHDFESEQVSVYWHYVCGSSFGRSTRVREKIFTTDELFKYANQVLHDTQLVGAIRMLAVSVGRLAPTSGQMNLFENNLAKKELSRAIDKINDRYGEYTVYPGQMFGTNDMARDRIGFRKTVSF